MLACACVAVAGDAGAAGGTLTWGAATFMVTTAAGSQAALGMVATNGTVRGAAATNGMSAR
jgi:hypothetical protein